MKQERLTIQKLLINDKWCIRRVFVRLYVEYFNYQTQKTNTAVFEACFVPCEMPSRFRPYSMSKARENIEMFNFNEVDKYIWDDDKSILTIFIKEPDESRIEYLTNPIKSEILK